MPATRTEATIHIPATRTTPHCALLSHSWLPSKDSTLQTQEPRLSPVCDPLFQCFHLQACFLLPLNQTLAHQLDDTGQTPHGQCFLHPLTHTWASTLYQFLECGGRWTRTPSSASRDSSCLCDILVTPRLPLHQSPRTFPSFILHKHWQSASSVAGTSRKDVYLPHLHVPWRQRQPITWASFILTPLHFPTVYSSQTLILFFDFPPRTFVFNLFSLYLCPKL